MYLKVGVVSGQLAVLLSICLLGPSSERELSLNEKNALFGAGKALAAFGWCTGDTRCVQPTVGCTNPVNESEAACKVEYISSHPANNLNCSFSVGAPVCTMTNSAICVFKGDCMWTGAVCIPAGTGTPITGFANCTDATGNYP